MKTSAKKINDARVLPHSIEAEQCVLGCAFIDQDASFNIVSTLKESDFYSETHKMIFSAMSKVFASNAPIDFVTITENLEKNGLLESVGGAEYLISLTNIVPGASNYEHYMNIVKNDSVLRQLISAGQDIINKSYEDVTKEDALSFAEQKPTFLVRFTLHFLGQILHFILSKYIRLLIFCQLCFLLDFQSKSLLSFCFVG